MHSSPQSSLLPDLSLLFAATLWGIFWYPLRMFEAAGMPAIWVVLMAFTAASSIGLVYTWKLRREYFIYPRRLFLIAITAGWCNAGFLLAVVDGNVIRVVLLFYMSPIWSVILGRLLLNETLSLRSFVLFALAFVGAMIMLWDPSIGFPWPQNLSEWLALSAGFTFSLSNVLIRSLQQVSISVKTTSTWVGGIVVAAAWIVLAGDNLPDITRSVWLYSLLLGYAGIFFMGISVQYGITHMPVYRSATILLFEVVVTAVSAYLIINETMTPLEWLGGIIVMLSGWLLARTSSDHCTGDQCGK